jgi:folate-binding protein YgfZ
VYAAAREGAAVAPLSDRGVLEVTGPLRQKFLQGLLSNDVVALGPGAGVLAALMDAKGRVLALLRALVTDDAVLLEIPAGRVEAVEAVLTHYRVAAPVRLAQRPTVVLAVLGPEAARIVAAAAGTSLPPGLPPQAHVPIRLAGHEGRVVRATDLPADGLVVHVSPDAAEAAREALLGRGAAILEPSELDVLRIEEGRPWYGPDVSEENLLHETGLLAEYHSATKGCYVGQEVVARLEGRGGHVSRALRGLRLGGPAVAGDPVTAAGNGVGRVTTAAESPRLGWLAMAYVHRSHFEPGTVVEVSGHAATVASLPLAGPPR